MPDSPEKKVASEPSVADEQLALALEAAGMGTWEWEQETDRIFWSAVTERMHGLQPGEFGGTLEAFGALVHADDWPEIQAAMASPVDQQRRYVLRYRAVAKDGSVRWIEGRGSVLASSGAGGRRVVGVSSDVTRRTRRQRSDKLLAEASEILGASTEYEENVALVARMAVPSFADWCTIDLLPDPLHARSGLPKRVATAHVLPSQVAFEEDLTRRFPERADSPVGVNAVLRTGHAVLVEQVDEAALMSLAVTEEHLQALEGLGLRSLISVPLRTRDKVLGAMTFKTAESGVHYDEEDLALAQRLAHQVAGAVERSLYHRQLEQLAAIRDEVLAIVSHDLRNPLNTIHVASTVLREEIKDPKVASRLDPIDRAVERANALIRDLLEVTTAEAGSLTISPRVVDAAAILDEIITIFSPQARAKEVSLELAVPPGDVKVTADRARVIQVLSNLMGNALRHVSDGGTVRLGVEPDQNAWRFFVHDDGPGIAPEQLPMLFEPFWQARKVRKKGGTGLGLAIARGIVEAHSGRIWVDTEADVGARFCFTLPSDRGSAPDPKPVSVLDS